MGKAKMIGKFKPFVANARADMRRAKAWQRSREYNGQRELALQESREKKLILEMERRKLNAENSNNV